MDPRNNPNPIKLFLLSIFYAYCAISVLFTTIRMTIHFFPEFFPLF